METLTPSPAKQEQTTGGQPRVKQLPAAPIPAPENPPAAVRQAQQAVGPAWTFIIEAMMISTKKSAELSFDILFEYIVIYGRKMAI